MEETIHDTEPEVTEQVEETTEEVTTEETVETFSEELDNAETEEELLELAKNIKPEEPEETQEGEVNDTEEEDVQVDTEAKQESSQDILTLKDGDIELQLNYQDEAEKQKLIRLAQQGLNYAGKTTELAKYRSFVQYAEENGISLEDIQKLADVKAGKKEALSAIAKEASIDLYDVDNDLAKEYNPEPVQLPPQTDPMLDTVANEILANEDYRSSFQKWFPTMPQDIQQAVTSDARVLAGIKEDLEAGLFDDAMQQAYKYQKLDGMDFASSYTRAKQELTAIKGDAPSTPPVTRSDRVRAASGRKVASPSTRSGGIVPGAISDMNDDEFLKNYQDIIRQVRETQG